MDSERSVALPLLVSLGLLVLALIIGRGFLGAAVALCAAVPGGYASWIGVQSKTQGKLLGGMVCMLAAVVVAGALVLLRFVSWLR